MKLHKRFQERVRSALLAEGISQGELARRMKVSPQTVSIYINGERCPGLDIIEKFSTALHLADPGLLLQEEEIYQTNV